MKNTGTFDYKYPEISFEMRQVPLGISLMDGYVCFATETSGDDKVRLSLYDAGSDRLLCRLPMKRLTRESDLFSILVKKEECIGLKYSFGCNSGEFADPYAFKISSPMKIKENSRKRTKGIVFFPEFSWDDENRPNYSYSQMVLYKLHIKGFTMNRNSGTKEHGTFGAVIEKLDYLKKLGINGVVLMPAYEFDDEIPQNIPFHENQTKKKINYWGYGAKAFYFAPGTAFASDRENASAEFAKLVNECHKAGIEVIMEMYFDNDVSTSFIISCLRFYSAVYHIDGFRFMSNIKNLDIISEDPYLRHVKLIYYSISEKSAEICGRNRNLAESSDAYTVSVRRFLKGDEEQTAPFRDALKRNPKDFACVNYITDSNGFTLCDLYSYDIKRNIENGEDNRDGADKNYSWSCGVEGVTRSVKIRELRMQMYKNALCALFVSQGTPMLLAGDEHLNSQSGNNNAYCQDNRVSWLDWNNNKQSQEMFSFIQKLIAIRKQNAVLSDVIEYVGSECVYRGLPKLSFHGTRAWYPDFAAWSRTLGIMFAGDEKRFYVIFNMHWEPHEFEIPKMVSAPEAVKKEKTYRILFETDAKNGAKIKKTEPSDENTTVSYMVTVPGRTAVMLESENEE